ncbi:MBL fold metallo-hydrolase [Bordetella genomosp. 7]|uniref:MBL fold metallo-hydrolase n=1 Tax=Bordetella genomosp. 7 TaxID=1416805 RepID=UPI000B9EE0FB|nr:MBL fold metallo-hydrolase [Bordetella genomosp. 7]OZI17547.1 MBL fold metallo-hydrolase [Bordetella genomosp. 7]
MAQSALIRAFFDEATNTVSYLVIDPDTMQAAAIDPVLDYDHRSGEFSTQSADAMVAAARVEGATIVKVLETHVHADHLSAAPHIKALTGATVGIGEHVSAVQKIFQPVFNLESLSCRGAEFDELYHDGQEFLLGALPVRVLHTPGHTPACVSYLIGDAVFVGDTLFMPDYGTARADFPGGDARVLYQSIRRLLALPPATRVFTCHDYKAPGRDFYAWESTVQAQRSGNVHVRDGVGQDEFVAMRTQRDAGLQAPALLLPSLQVNLRAGGLPQAEDNGIRYLKIPMRAASAS